MFSSIRKLTALVLAAMFMCMMVPVQAETADLDVEVVFGTVNNDTYENPYLGLGCTLEGWHYYSDEELEGVNQRTKDALSDELDDLVDQNIGIMMAEQPDGMLLIARHQEVPVAVNPAPAGGFIAVCFRRKLCRGLDRVAQTVLHAFAGFKVVFVPPS